MSIFTSTTTATTSTKKKTAKTLDGRLLCAATLAYEIREPYLSGAGFLSEPQQIDKEINSCLIGRTQDGIVISFRGTTNDAMDWLQNTSAKLMELPPQESSRSSSSTSTTKNKNIPIPSMGRVHKGFYNALYKTGLADEIRTALLELLPSSCKSSTTSNKPQYKSSKRCKVYLTGHSKGGAMASLFALDMWHSPDLPNPEHVFSFGSPRLGDAHFANYYFSSKIQQTTYENHMDMIPLLPPSSSSKSGGDSTSLMEKIQKQEDGGGCKGASCAKNQKWEYAPIGMRKFISPDKQIIVHNVTQELDRRRIREFEQKTILRLGEFRQAHCSSCPDIANGCSGGYFLAIAPEICNSAQQ